MRAARLLRTLDIHVSGWPLRILFDTRKRKGEQTLSERAELLWNDERVSVRWLQREPRGHAAMRIGVLGESARADYSLLVFDADGPCAADVLDALGAAGALTETGIASGVEAVTFETSEGIMAVKEEDERGLRAIASEALIGKHDYSLQESGSLGLALRPENAARIERELQSGTMRNRKVILFEDAEEEKAIALLGRDGKLLRAPGGEAVGEIVSHFYERDWGRGELIRLRGLSGGLLEAVITSKEFEPGESGESGESDNPAKPAKLRWELRARVRLIGSCEFLLDSRDPHGDGFLLRG